MVAKLIDLTGKPYGKWTVKRRGANTPDGKPCWECLCECGTERTVRASALRNGSSTSCGCSTVARLKSKFIDLTGEEYGLLRVDHRGEDAPNGGIRWWCQCKCGNPKLVLVRANNLKREKPGQRYKGTRSCSCLRVSEAAAKFIDMTSQTHKNFIVLGRATNSPAGKPRLRVEFKKCGHIATLFRSNLLVQHGCGKCGDGRKWRSIDLVGKKSGSLTCEKYSHSKGQYRRRRVQCRCDCGTPVALNADYFRSGKKKDCGPKCPLREQSEQTKEPTESHSEAAQRRDNRQSACYPKRRRGRPAGTTDPAVANRDKKMLDAWRADRLLPSELQQYGTPADLARHFDVDPSYARKVIQAGK